MGQQIIDLYILHTSLQDKILKIWKVTFKPLLEVLELVQYKDKTRKKKKLTINKSKIAA